MQDSTEFLFYVSCDEMKGYDIFVRMKWKLFCYPVPKGNTSAFVEEVNALNEFSYAQEINKIIHGL